MEMHLKYVCATHKSESFAPVQLVHVFVRATAIGRWRGTPQREGAHRLHSIMQHHTVSIDGTRARCDISAGWPGLALLARLYVLRHPFRKGHSAPSERGRVGSLKAGSGRLSTKASAPRSRSSHTTSSTFSTLLVPQASYIA
jgi:hypothetical protein